VTSLRERFDDAAASPAPPSRLSAAEVYAAAWRRRRVRTGLVAVAGGFTAVVLVVAVVVGTAGSGRHQETAGPRPSGSSASPKPSPTGPSGAFVHDGVVLGATATDGSHLYAIQAACPTDQIESCTTDLLGSDDAGQSWTVRSHGIDDLGGMSVPAPGVLLVGQGKQHISTDGGRTWTALTFSAGARAVQTVAADGWVACVSAKTGGCALYAVDPHSGTARRLAHQPAMAVYSVQHVPVGAGLWVTGSASGTGHAAVAVSLDHGKTWTTHVFGPGEPDYPTTVSGSETALTASLDGTTAYTVVSISMIDETQAREFVYRTDDGGKTWHRTDPRHTLPWAYHGDESYIAADGTHVVASVAGDPAQWYGSRDDGSTYQRPAGVTGLTGLQDMREAVRVIAPGVYVAYDTTAVFRSTDGLHWTRLPLPTHPR